MNNKKSEQIWRLGKHVMICADSRNHAKSKEEYDVVFTDPPYGVGHVGRTSKVKQFTKIENDALKGAHLTALIHSSLPSAKAWYICASWKTFSAFEQALGKPNNLIVWNKGHFGLGSNYRPQHEFILFYGRHRRRDVSDLWTIKRERLQFHPAQKPVRLVTEALSHAATDGDRVKVYDPFAGSCTTLFACEVLGFHGTAVEIEEKYCQIAIDRWNKLYPEQRAERIA